MIKILSLLFVLGCVAHSGEIDLLLELDRAEVSENVNHAVYPMMFPDLKKTEWGIFQHAPGDIRFRDNPWGDNAILSFSIALLPGVFTSDSDGVTFKILVSVESEEEIIFERSLDPSNHQDFGLHSYSLSLPDLSGREGDIILRTEEQGHPYSDWCFWGDVFISWDEQPGRIDQSLPNVILITIDTLRYDYLSKTGNAYIQTPAIDRLIDEGILFTQAYSNSSTTNPSHASLLSSRYPYEMNMLSNRSVYMPYMPRVHEIFTDSGYRSSASVSVSHFLPDLSGFGTGFDQFTGPDFRWVKKYGPDFARSTRFSKTTTSAALKQIHSDPESPFFMWIHYYDPHTPYIAHGEFHRKYYPGDPNSVLHNSMSSAIFSQTLPEGWDYWLHGFTDLDYFKREYAAEISAVDHQIGRLMEALERGGIDDKTMIVITADHGENLGDHNIYFDHWTMYNTDLHVPLIIWYPEEIQGGVVVDEPVTLLDVSPTIVDYFGFSGDGGNPIANTFFRGTSLRPVMEGGYLPANRIHIAHGLYFMHCAAWNENYKIIWEIIGGRYHERYTMLPDRVYVFDRVRDPDELSPVATFYWKDAGKPELPWEITGVPVHREGEIEDRMKKSRLRIAEKKAPSEEELRVWFTGGSPRNVIEDGWLDREGFLQDVARLMDALLESARPEPIELEIRELREWSDEYDSIQSVIDDPVFNQVLEGLGYIQ